MSPKYFLFSILLLIIPAQAIAQTEAQLQFVSSKAIPIFGNFLPLHIDLGLIKPASFHKLPDGLRSPMFGTFNFRLASGAQEVPVILDAPDNAPAKLYVDANGNGDFTDDPAVDWGQSSQTSYIGAAILKMGEKNSPLDARVMFNWVHDDPEHPGTKQTLFYFRDYARVGQITLSGKTHKAALTDDFCTGDFRGKPSADPQMKDFGSGVFLLIDANDNGKLESIPSKRFDATKPFNFGGTTYELRAMTPSGQFATVQSKKSVEEIVPPPNLNPGQPALSFEAKTMDGQTVHFPADYKGKIVLLDFWATWCPGCVQVAPSMAATYQKYHARNFEILGISLDEEKSGNKIREMTKQFNMTWPEVYDAMYWSAPVAKLYGIQSLPTSILVDGDTGKILASEESEVLGDALGATLEKELVKKFVAPAAP